ncbi:MAG: glutamine--fructose-6-phosphate transaminase (isomerizing), partial [Thiomonas sp.]
MCGIVGAVAQRNIVPVLIEGLRRLEYRGYDSCGVAVYANGQLQRARSVARVAELDAQTHDLQAFTGIAHTRWATHGAPTTSNAHPHFSAGPNKAAESAHIAVVHNGIIENYEALRAMLRSDGYQFESQTDTEVIAHLIDHLYAGDLFEAVQAATRQLHGAYAIAVFSREEPHRIVGAREGSPLVVGLGKGENFLASDALALAGTTDQFIYLEDGDVADLQLGKVWIVDRDHKPVEREVRTITAHTAAVELGPYRHFMQKEIFEQPRAIADTLDGVQAITPALFGAQAAAVFPAISGVRILACGTSFYAGLTAKYWIESIARVPVDVEVASEYRTGDSVPDPDTLVIGVSQSGETADTLSALRHARSLGMTRQLAICNVAGSAMMRESALHFLTHAGVEIGVASTKAFTTQLVALYLLAGALARAKGRLSDAQEAQMLTALRHLPAAVQSVLALEPQIIAWAEAFARRENALFLGRGMH